MHPTGEANSNLRQGKMVPYGRERLVPYDRDLTATRTTNWSRCTPGPWSLASDTPSWRVCWERIQQGQSTVDGDYSLRVSSFDGGKRVGFFLD